jgi:hypothetical protein
MSSEFSIFDLLSFLIPFGDELSDILFYVSYQDEKLKDYILAFLIIHPILIFILYILPNCCNCRINKLGNAVLFGIVIYLKLISLK